MMNINKNSLVSILIAGGILVTPLLAFAQVIPADFVSYSQKQHNVNLGGPSGNIYNTTSGTGSSTGTGTSGNGSTSGTTGSSTGSSGSQNGPQPVNLFGNLFAAIFGGTTSATDKTVSQVFSLVMVPGTTAVYQIINGQKHFIPTAEIFSSYGYTADMVKDITAKDLAKYPRATLFTVTGDKSKNPIVYYLTEAGTIRPMLDEQVLDSYGDNHNNIITINSKEFNFYPHNEFVFVLSPTLSRDVFQLIDGNKRYITPMALRRLKLSPTQLSPINIAELDQYSPAQPVIF